MDLLSLPAAGLLAASLATTAQADQPAYRIVRVITPVAIVSMPGPRPVVVIRRSKVAPVKRAKVPATDLIQASARK